MLKLNVDFYVNDTALQQTGRNVAADEVMRRSQITIQEGGLDKAFQGFRQGVAPDLAVIEVTDQDRDAILQRLDQLAEETPHVTHVVIAGHVDSARLYRDLVELGVDSYVVLPTDADEMMNIIYGIFGESDAGRSTQISVFAAKGGVGASTVAHNMALRLAHGPNDVCLIDADLAFGTVSMNLNHDPQTSLRPALHNVDELDDKTIDRYLIRHSVNLAFMADLAQLDDDTPLTPERLNALLDVLDRNFEYIIIDLPQTWNDVTRGLICECPELVFVVQPDINNAENLQMLADYTSTFRRQKRPHIVINQKGLAPELESEETEISKAAGYSITATIPNDHRFRIASRDGEMLAADPKQNKDIVTQVDKITEAIGGGAKHRTRKGRIPGRQGNGSLLKRLFKRN